MILRDYQIRAIKDLYQYWEDGKGVTPIVCLPTGSGKSLFVAEFCKQVCTETPHVRIMVVTHSRELISQNEQELRTHYPEASTGIFSAGLGKYQTHAQIIFAGIQSVYKRVFGFPKIDIVIIDECHLIPREAETRYGRFFTDLRIFNPNVVIWGCTATPFRLDSGLLHEGKGALFDGIAHCTNIKTLIDQKYLVPPISKGGVKKIDLTGVKIQAGDYAPGELAHAADDPELVRLAVEEIVRFGQDRKAWLIYCAGVEHAEHVAAEFKKHGKDCAIVTGDTPKEERDEILSKFKTGTIRCVANVMVLTTGFNAPRCDLIALLMSTMSTGKYVQICGRGLRTYPGKENCLVLDFGGNILRHGPIDEIDPVRKKNVFCVEKKPPPQKECPQCHAIVPARTSVCICGYFFPVTAPHGTEAYSGAVLSNQQTVAIIEVKDVWYSRHQKPGKPDSVKIGYFDSMDKEYPMWLALDAGGYASDKAQALVKQLGGKSTTVTESLAECDYWKKPIAIQVKPEGKFTRITGFIFEKDKQGEL
jgi:DNA repair protein RadD